MGSVVKSCFSSSSNCLWYPMPARREFSLSTIKQTVVMFYLCCGSTLCKVIGSNPPSPVPLAPARFLAEDMMFRFGQSRKLLGVKVSELVRSRHAQGSAALVHNFQFSLWPPYESKAIIFSLISSLSAVKIKFRNTLA